MNLIDIPLTQEQFDDFDAAVVNALCNATRSDLREWSARLLQAWATDDAEAISRARHALKGLCGNYGAQALMAMAAHPLTQAELRREFQSCVEATIAAILAIAHRHSAG